MNSYLLEIPYSEYPDFLKVRISCAIFVNIDFYK
jgi:hypothetical protein